MSEENWTKTVAIALLTFMFLIGIGGIIVGLRKMREADRFEALCNRQGGRVIEVGGRTRCAEVREIHVDFGR